MTSRFWDGYWACLKPREVEETIDVWVHRPIAYLLAQAVYHTPVSPNAITVCSMLLGVAAFGYVLVGRLVLAGTLVFLSAVFDCADGQLARMRGTSSALGRALDGLADGVVTVATVGGGIYLVWQKYGEPLPLGIAALALCAATAVTGSFHTSLYDHYKNVFLRLTNTKYQSGEYLDTAEAQVERRREGLDPISWLALTIYLSYLKGQLGVARWFDPYLGVELGKLPPYGDRVAALYREQSADCMRIWRGFFGFGSLIFGLAVSIALNIVEWYMLARLVLLNGLFLLYLRPAQRRVSKSVMDALSAPEGVA
jgi:hypothetical protein